MAGNCKDMPAAVREEFVNVAKNCGGMDQDQAENFVRTLEKSGRYQSETW